MSAVGVTSEARKRQRSGAKDSQCSIQQPKRTLQSGHQLLGLRPTEKAAQSLTCRDAPAHAVVVVVDRSVRANDARRSLAQQIARSCENFTVLPVRSLDNCPHPRVTHVVVGSGLLADDAAGSVARQRLGQQLAKWPGVLVLNETWLTQLTASRRLPPTAGFAVHFAGTSGHGHGSSSAQCGGNRPIDPASTALPGPRQPASLAEGRFERWLGWWSPELNGASEVTVMLQARFNNQRCARVGNSAIVAGLRELKQFELAVRESDDVVGTRALAYARAAAAVQACAFRITSHMPDAFLARSLPFVSRSCASTIRQLAESAERAAGAGRRHSWDDEGGAGSSDSGESDSGSRNAASEEMGNWREGSERGHGSGAGQGGNMDGNFRDPAGVMVAVTCERLEQFRRDLPVRDGSGALRPETEGAASKRRLCKLPGVGPSTAKSWYDKGCRTLDDALALLRAGQLHPPVSVAWALQHHADLTAEVTPEEVSEMRAAVVTALAAAVPHQEAASWQVVLVGGGRRGRASHDVDLMISHPAVVEWEDVHHCFNACVARLVKDGHLLPAEGNLTRIQRDAFYSYQERLMKELAGLADDGGKRRINDGLDHIFGVFRTRRGRLKRLDLIFCTAPCLPHALLGWSGSTQFLRFLHQHADTRGLRRTNTGLYCKNTRRPVEGIVDEAGIFAALGLLHREPEDRQCP